MSQNQAGAPQNDSLKEKAGPRAQVSTKSSVSLPVSGPN